MRSNALTDAALSRFDPLARIISFDDFDRGFCGWTQLVGNYEDSLDAMLPGYAQHSSPMLSTLSHWDIGSHGGVDGDYALKIATTPNPGAQNVSIKRLTYRKAGPIRMEAYVTFKPEANELKLSETDVRSFGFLFDLQVGDKAGGGRTGDAASAVSQRQRWPACAEMAVQALIRAHRADRAG